METKKYNKYCKGTKLISKTPNYDGKRSFFLIVKVRYDRSYLIKRLDGPFEGDTIKKSWAIVDEHTLEATELSEAIFGYNESWV